MLIPSSYTHENPESGVNYPLSPYSVYEYYFWISIILRANRENLYRHIITTHSIRLIIDAWMWVKSDVEAHRVLEAIRASALHNVLLMGNRIGFISQTDGFAVWKSLKTTRIGPDEYSTEVRIAMEKIYLGDSITSNAAISIGRVTCKCLFV